MRETRCDLIHLLAPEGERDPGLKHRKSHTNEGRWDTLREREDCGAFQALSQVRKPLVHRREAFSALGTMWPLKEGEGATAGGAEGFPSLLW